MLVIRDRYSAGRFGDRVPREFEIDSIRRIREQIDSNGDAPGWLDWLGVPPVAPGVSETIELQPLG